MRLKPGGRRGRVALAASGVALLLASIVVAVWFASGRPDLSDMRAAQRYRQATGAGSEAERMAALVRVLEVQPRHPQAMLQLAEHAMREGRLEAAFLRFLSLVEAHPGLTDGWLGLARVRAAAGQTLAAALAADEAVALAPDLVAARRLRADLCLQTQRNVCAEVEGRALIRLAPNDPIGASVLGEATSRLAGPSDPAPRAVASIDEAAKWPGQLGAGMREFGHRLQRQEWDAAAGLADEALRRWPGTFLGDWLHGLVELSRGRLVEAEKRLLAALSRAPRSHRVLTSLTATWARRDGPRSAGERLSEIVEHDPGALYAASIAAQAFLQAREPALAEASLRRALAASPRSMHAYAHLARFHLELDQADAALGTVSAGLAALPHDATLQLLHARTLTARGDSRAAIDVCRRVLASRPDADAAAGLLVLLLLDQGADSAAKEVERRQALDLVDRLERNAPNDAMALEAIGRARWALNGDVEGARAWLTAARDAAPDEPRIRYRLGAVLARLGRDADAANELRAALEHGQTFREEAEARRLLASLGAVGTGGHQR